MSTALLELACDCLGELADEVVFVGGAAVGLWISDPGAPTPRVTNDVDVIIVATYAEYDGFAQRLRARGLRSDATVICRHRHASGLILDVMPTDSAVLGFTNRWYREAVGAAGTVALPSGRMIRAVRPPWLVATKLEAFAGRGRDDPITSADFEDLVRLVDGRPELAGEIAAAPVELRKDVAAAFDRFAARADFREIVEAALPLEAGSSGRVEVVAGRWRAIAGRSG
ncbi:MAG TPA: hypothetical protein PKD59_00120 [Miltoncostaeaceae bacterium]|nr:hypothetical protein [Miltoncostaeaceae bacterium]